MSLSAEGAQEQQDLQCLLRGRIEVVAHDVMLLSEEFDKEDRLKDKIPLASSIIINVYCPKFESLLNI